MRIFPHQRERERRKLASQLTAENCGWQEFLNDSQMTSAAMSAGLGHRYCGALFIVHVDFDDSGDVAVAVAAAAGCFIHSVKHIRRCKCHCPSKTIRA